MSCVLHPDDASPCFPAGLLLSPRARLMGSFYPGGPGFPLAEAGVPWPALAADRTVRVPSPFTPVFSFPRVEPAAAPVYPPRTRDQKDRRKNFLERSVFELVEAVHEMALTDYRLLQWYLCLCQEDRDIIMEGGSFYNFLQRHPALEVSQDHVSLRYRYGYSLAGVASFQQTSEMSRSPTCGSSTYGSPTCGSSTYGAPMDRSPLDRSPMDGAQMEGSLTYGSQSESCEDRRVYPSPITKPSVHTQTEVAETAGRPTGHIHEGDSYSLAEDFKVKLTLAERPESLACKTTDCDGMRRAQRAELRLLTLQYSMCRQHIWRLFHANQLNALPQHPPANMVGLLKELESDYNELRRLILMGVPPEQLRPLSVDSEKMAAGALYIPAKAIADLLGDVSSWTSHEPLEREAAEVSGSRDDASSASSQVAPCGGGFHHSQKQEKQMSEQKPSLIVPTSVVDEIIPAAACGEACSSESWYDAVEELHREADAEAKQDPDSTCGSCSDEANQSVLSSHVTQVHLQPPPPPPPLLGYKRGQGEALPLFEEFHPPEVTVSASDTDPRVPTGKETDLKSEEGAAAGTTGHQCRRSHEEVLGSRSRASQDGDAPQAEKKPLTSPLSSRTRKVVCISPTAKETCVPQHFGTMGSINTLTDELMRRHPNTGRKRIADALMELRALHPGVLSSLPLKTVRDMTSELLTRPAATAETSAGRLAPLEF